MTHFEYYRKTLEEIQKEKPDMEEIATFFLGGYCITYSSNS